jgi:hypothetical protein
MRRKAENKNKEMEAEHKINYEKYINVLGIVVSARIRTSVTLFKIHNLSFIVMNTDFI